MAYGGQASQNWSGMMFSGCATQAHEEAGVRQSIARAEEGVDRGVATDWITCDAPTPEGSGQTGKYDPEDPDRDGLRNEEEQLLGTDPAFLNVRVARVPPNEEKTRAC